MSELFSPAIVSLFLSGIIIFVGLLIAKKNKKENIDMASRISIKQDDVDDILDKMKEKNKLTSKENNLTFFEKKKMQLVQSNCGINFSSYIVMMIISVLIVFLIVYKIIGISFIALLFSLLGTKIPNILIQKKQSRNIESFNTQLIKALRRMASVMRSGGSIKQALIDIKDARSMPNIIKKEFKVVLTDIEYGISIEDALYKLYERTGSKDVRLLSISIAIQRNLGGNIARTLDTISQSISNRNLMEQEVKTSMGQLKASSTILSIMPFFISGILYVLNPGHFEPLFETIEGRFMLLFCIIFILTGTYIINKMAKIEI